MPPELYPACPTPLRATLARLAAQSIAGSRRKPFTVAAYSPPNVAPVSEPYPDHARRTLAEVLLPKSIAALQALCETARHRWPESDRMRLLSRYAELSPKWRPIIAVALATDPEQVEAWLTGAAPLPGALARRSERSQVWPYAEAARRAEASHRAAQAEARRIAREASRRAPTSERLPRGWQTIAGQVDLRTLIPLLGLTETKSGAGPCPCCDRPHRSAHDRRSPLGIRGDGRGWKCHACQTTGDGLHLAAMLLVGERKPATPDAWETVGRWFEGQGLLR